MGAKVMLAAVAAGVLAAGSLVILPQPYGPAVLAGCAGFVFGIYVLRERAAIRGLFAVTRNAERSSTERLTAVQKQLAQVRKLTEDRGSSEERLLQLSRRLDAVVKELGGLNAAAANEILGRQRQQQESLDRIRQQLDGGGVPSATDLRRLRDELLIAAKADFRQLEALTGLHSLFAVRAPLPPSRKWAASPDVLLYLTSLVMERRPKVILELGSGLSTLWLAYAVKKSDYDGHIVSLDHDEKYSGQTRSMLLAHGLSELAEVRHAPIRDLEIDGETRPWYDLEALADVKQCDLVFVDGPAAAIGEKARYPALPVLMSRLAPSAVVVLDDCIRQDEKDIVEQWSQEYPEWTIEMIDHEKVTAVLSRSESRFS